MGRYPELLGDGCQAPELDESRDGPARLLDAAIHDEGVDLVGERPRLAEAAVVAYFPLDDHLAIGALLPDLDIRRPLLGEPMHRVAGEGRLDPDGVEGHKLLALLGLAVGWLHGLESKKQKTTTDCPCCCLIRV